MASTSTNKQPLLIDRPLHIQKNITSEKTGSTNFWLANNSCSLFLDCTQNDGALIEDLYVISKEASQHNIAFFMATTADYLRETDSNVTFVSRIQSSSTPGQITHGNNLPLGIAPYPAVGLDSANQRTAGQFQSIYVPKGKALWVGRAVTAATANLTVDVCPVAGAQGGFY